MAGWRKYVDLKVGDVFPDAPVAFEVTPDAVAGYRAVAQRSLVAPTGASGHMQGVPPMLAAVYIRGAQNALNGPPGGIHAKQHFTFRRPVRLGETLATSLTVVDKYERNGRRYVVSETSSRDSDGIEVTRGRITQIWGQEV